ncbi:MAG: hypothetical protein AABP62_20220 [Planctomycetota bacterium]
MIRYALLASCAAVGLSSLGSSRCSAVDLTPVIPTEVSPRAQIEFDAFGWKEFVALNWPANADGTPNTTITIGQSDDVARVWQFWMGPSAVFKSDGSKPTWTPGAGLTSYQLTKAPDDIATPFVDALHFPIVDQDRNFAVLGLGMNKVMFDYIVENNLYNKEGQRTGADGNRLPIGKEKFVSFPRGSMEIKTAWRMFPEHPSPADLELMKRYYITKSTVRIAARNSRDSKDREIVANLGLVAMHIVQKTPQDPQWVWSTFEQIDNLIPAPNQTKATFRNPTEPDQNPILTPVPPGVIPNIADPTKPYAQPYLWDLAAPFATPNQRIPTQVNRVTPIMMTAQDNNIIWQRSLKEVSADSKWQYYQTIGTQWPTKPYARKPGETPMLERFIEPPGSNPTIATYEGAPEPAKLANIPMEVYNQKTSSCIVCHSKAFTTNGDYSDFSYLLQLAKPKQQ